MSAAEWADLVRNAVWLAEHGEAEYLDRLARLLEEQDQVRQRLREAGHTWIGRPLREAIEELLRHQADGLP